MLTKTDIERYFIAEKQVGLILAIVGIVAIIAAILCWLLLRTQFYKGAALPLLIIGLFQLYIGISLQKRSDAHRVRNVYAFDMNPQELKEKELPRMQQAYKTITSFLTGELVLLLAGLIVVVLYRSKPERAWWLGLGVALVIQCLIMAGAEFNARQKAKTFIDKLVAFKA
ncbi:hypothetical protein [Paraflavitalea sp. CAU 1676]|uniref:hypothetical protein n=1 Tax=Paraflavitalea sp. CAU 1676 TaxID=3032598 RepID=UPI0023DB0C07|nr:hypothetical protein [Paraflavitalea sp. CAU 1676]MDF2190766.1 hypothetical protein [Paraflavitalea sp. CAU 1676]